MSNKLWNRNSLVLLFVCFCLITSKAQMQSSRDFGDELNLNNAEVIELPSIPLSIKSSIKRVEGKMLKKQKYAHDFKVEYDILNNGEWNLNEYGENEWGIAFYSNGAKSLGVYFSDFTIPEGARVYVYNENMKRGPFTYSNVNVTGGLPVLPISGNKIYIKYILPYKSKISNNLKIGNIYHDYIGIGDLSKDGRFGLSQSCEININCEEGDDWQTLKHSVIRLEIGGVYCTGILVNNIEEDGKPYVLTANHCVSDSNQAARVIAVFNYESPTCKVVDGSVDHVMYGNNSIGASLFRAGKDTKDFTLLELTRKPPFAYQPYYAGWSSTENERDSVVCLHHPQGDVKKISIDNDSVFIGTYDSDFKNDGFWNVQRWDLGATEGGSSGSPLFDENKRVFGTLTGGIASCGNPIDDYYARLYTAWDEVLDSNLQLAYWLANSDANIREIDGFDPYKRIIESCDTISNIDDMNSMLAVEFNLPDTGNWVGLNSFRYNEYQERFTNYEYGKISGFYLNVCRTNSTLSSNINFIVRNSIDESDNSIVWEKAIPLNFFSDSTLFFIACDSLIPVRDTFYVGIELDHEGFHEGNRFGVFVDTKESSIETDVYIRDGEEWIASQDAGMHGEKLSMDIRPVICEGSKSSYIEEPDMNVGSPDIVYSRGRFYFKKKLSGEVKLEVVSLNGQLVKTDVIHVINQYAIFDISGLQNGLYIIKCSVGESIFKGKIIKIE